MTGQAEDVDRIMAIMAAAFDPAYGEAWTRRQVEDALVSGSCHYLLIGPNGEMPAQGEAAAGFALLRASLDEEELLLFAIHPAWRRLGLGRRLLRNAIETARSSDHLRILLEMRQGNSAEILYRSEGFLAIGLRPKYYRAANGERLDAVTFACEIGPECG